MAGWRETEKELTEKKCISQWTVKKKRLLYFAVEYYTAVEKEGMLTLCDSVVGPGEFYAK